MSLAECQIILIDLNFHLQKCLEIFYKNSADKIQSKNYEGGKSALPHANYGLIVVWTSQLYLGMLPDERMDYFPNYSKCLKRDANVLHIVKMSNFIMFPPP